MSLMLMIIAEAWQSITAYRLRSFLTTLGIIIGVAAVILTLAIGNGIQHRIGEAMKRAGTTTLTVMPTWDNKAKRNNLTRDSNYLTVQDAEAIRNITGVTGVAPISTSMFQVMNGTKFENPNVVGTTPDIAVVRGLELREGEMFTQAQLRGGALVAVLGAKLAESLGSTAGGTIRTENNTFLRVVGVLREKGQGIGGMDQDNVLLVPIKTMQRQFSGGYQMDRIWQIELSVVSPRFMDSVTQEIESLLRERQRIDPLEPLPYQVRNVAAMIKVASSTSNTIAWFLIAAAAISLVVGGIGIMNIMLVSVAERTQEIAIRKVSGASDGMIMAQFLLEAAMLCLVGCCVGILIGFASNGAVAELTGLRTSIHLDSVLAAVAVSSATGLLFGYYPARKAASLEPAEALRR